MPMFERLTIKKRKYSPNLLIISYSRKMSSLLFLHHLSSSHPSSSHWQIPMRSEKTHLRNQTLITPPLGQPNSNGDLLFCLTNVFFPSDKSPSFSLKQPPLTLSWVLRPYFLALVVGTWHSPSQIESSIPLEKGQGSSGAKDTLCLELLKKEYLFPLLRGWKPGAAHDHPPPQGKSPPENESNTKESWKERQRKTESHSILWALGSSCAWDTSRLSLFSGDIFILFQCMSP